MSMKIQYTKHSTDITRNSRTALIFFLIYLKNH